MNLIRWLGLVMCGLMVACVGFAGTTINSTNKWAWGAGTGWINCAPDPTNGAVLGEYVCSGYLYSPTVGWIHLGSGAPTNGTQYCNVATNDYGVNHDGKGNLRGFAWATSIGWITFEPTGAPFVELTSGCVTGYIWSATSGWISFSNLAYFTQSDSMDTGPDTDNDTIPDMWELAMTGSTTLLSRTGDWDHDGVLDPQEYLAGTDPKDSNSLLQIQSLVLTNGTNVSLTWASSPTRLYRIERSEALAPTGTWADAGPGLMLSDTTTNSTQILPATSPTQRYYRIKAALPM